MKAALIALSAWWWSWWRWGGSPSSTGTAWPPHQRPARRLRPTNRRKGPKTQSKSRLSAHRIGRTGGTARHPHPHDQTYRAGRGGLLRMETLIW